MALAALQAGDPQAIAGYRLIGRLGAGGMGVVFLADRADGRLVAIKVMRAELASEASFRTRFAREASAVVRVQSACTARVLAVDATAPRPFLVMEYVAGPSVADQVAMHGALTAQQVEALALGLAAALTAIHAAGVVHRDLKPANVLLGPHGPRVIDFGIAQTADATALTGTGTAVGSPGYMAPEHLTEHAGPASDIFAWALTVSFAATGRPPFGAGPAASLAYRILHDAPDTAGVPTSLRALLEAALAKDPAIRPTAAQLVQQLLDRTSLHASLTDPRGGDADDHVAAAQVTRMWMRTRIDTDIPRRRPRRGILIVAAAIVGLLVGVAAVLLLPHPAAIGGGNPAAAGPAPSATTVNPPPTRTRVTIYQPWTPDGLANQIVVTQRGTGSCFSTSDAADRADAYRCSAGNELDDPCFSNPFGAGDAHPQVACPATDPDHVTLITLTDPLPTPPPDPSSPASTWDVQLANGAMCTIDTGATTTVDDLRLNYFCSDGGSLYGDPDTSTAIWTIRYQAKNAPNLEIVEIASAYQ